jgi:hypothetical protein
MDRLTPLLWLVMLPVSLVAQSADSTTARQEKYALLTLTKYCDAVENFSHSQPPRLFAQAFAGLEATSGWVEFSGRAEWSRAGSPQPLALVWHKDGQVVRVSIASKEGDQEGHAYADYCFRADGSLARLRAVPELQTDCDPFLFHCSLTLRGERLYPPKGHLPEASATPARPVVCGSPGCSMDEENFFLQALQSERTSFALTPLGGPEYLSIRELPFGRLLEASWK